MFTRAAVCLGLFLATGCRGETAPAPATDPSCFDSEHPTSISAAPTGLPENEWKEGDALVIDLEACAAGRWFGWLPLGSAWVAVRPTGDHCELWLGGETENPNYDGLATQYCRFRRDHCVASVELQAQGGPAHLTSPACTP
jgi:hypothetical protein